MRDSIAWGTVIGILAGVGSSAIYTTRARVRAYYGRMR